MNIRTLKNLSEKGYTIPSTTILDPLFLDAGVALSGNKVIAFGEPGFETYERFTLPGSEFKKKKFTVRNGVCRVLECSDQAKPKLMAAIKRIKPFVIVEDLQLLEEVKKLLEA